MSQQTPNIKDKKMTTLEFKAEELSEEQEKNWKTPSWVLRTAANDLEVCLKLPDYHIDMRHWHKYYRNQKACSVCLAGAVLANTFKLKKTDDPSVMEAPTIFKNALTGLDYFRAGSVFGFISDVTNTYAWGSEKLKPLEDEIKEYERLSSSEYEGLLSEEATLRLIDAAREWSDKLASIGM